MPNTYADAAESLAVAPGRAVGGAALSLTAGTGSKFSSPSTGDPTPSAPMRIGVYRGGSTKPLTVLKCTGRSGDTLTISGTMDGYADAAVLVGDVIDHAVFAGDMRDVQDAIINISLTPGPKGDPGTPGSVWREGTGAPSDSLGIDGDYYLDGATGNVYVRASGAYSTNVNIRGPQGDAGSQGSPGSPGTPGSVWREGAGAPSTSLGVDGDYYLDGSTGDVYVKASGAYATSVNIKGPKGDTGATGATGSTGATGPAGTDGATWHTGSGAPASSLGADGDLYIDESTSKVYVKASGAWSLAFDMATAWYFGTTAPNDSVGSDGDFYLRTDTGDLYQRESGVYTLVVHLKGPQGDTGAAGTPGSVLRNGTGAPSNTLGIDGDYYLDDGTGDLYERASGVYGVVANLKGPKGDTGSGGTGSGTLSSVGLSMPSGLTVDGSPLTADGTITVSTALSGLVKGETGGFVDATPGVDYVLPSGSITGTAGSITGVAAVANGGTGLSAAGTANQVLGVNAAGDALEYKTLTAGSNITISDTAGAITITASGGGTGSTGAVTFTDSGDATSSTISTSKKSLILQQTGDDLGTFQIIIENRAGQAGPVFRQNGGIPVDVGFENDFGTMIQRFENRASYAFTGGAELEYGVVGAPSFVAGVDFAEVFGGLRIETAANRAYNLPVRAMLDVNGSIRVGDATTSTTPYDAPVESAYVGVDTSAAAITITLPHDEVSNKERVVKDETGHAGTNPITITTTGAGTIDGSLTVSIASNYGYVRLFGRGNNNYAIVGKG